MLLQSPKACFCHGDIYALTALSIGGQAVICDV
jgi:hypothetical protein